MHTNGTALQFKWIVVPHH